MTRREQDAYEDAWYAAVNARRYPITPHHQAYIERWAGPGARRCP